MPLSRRKGDFDGILIHTSRIECAPEIPEGPKNVYRRVESGQSSILPTIGSQRQQRTLRVVASLLDLRYYNNRINISCSSYAEIFVFFDRFVIWFGYLVVRRPRQISFVTVIGSSLARGDDGRAALTLWTKERGPIAFAISAHTIQIIREELAEAESSIGEGCDTHADDS